MKQVPISKTWAEDTENKIIPTEQETANGINFQAQIESDVTNGFVNQLYEAVKYEQRTGGYYNSFIPYEINSTVKILVNENGTKSILSLLRISGNEEANRPPFTGATETDVNGVIEWSGGTFNSSYWKEIESKSLLERDKPIADTGSTITFDSSGTIVLTNTATTRTISSGLWVGQTATLFNSTANTITITDGLNTFEIPANRHFTYIWTGTRWQSKLVYVGLKYSVRPVSGDDGLWTTYQEVDMPWFNTGTTESEWEELFANKGAYARTPYDDRVGAVDEETGIYEAEIQNRIGVFYSTSIGNITPSGIVTRTLFSDSSYNYGSNNLDEWQLKLDLSRGSEVYKEGATVQPKNYDERLFKYIGV